MWLDGYTVLCRECPDLVAVYESSGGRLALLLRHTPVPLMQEYGAWRAETRKTAHIIVAKLRKAGLRGGVIVLQWLPLSGVAKIVRTWVCRYEGDATRRAQLAAVAERYAADDRFLATRVRFRRRTPSPADRIRSPFTDSAEELYALRRWYEAMAPCWLGIEPALRQTLVLRTHRWVAERLLAPAAAGHVSAHEDLGVGGRLWGTLAKLIPANERAAWRPWLCLVVSDLEGALRRPIAKWDQAWARWLLLIAYSLPAPVKPPPASRPGLHDCQRLAVDVHKHDAVTRAGTVDPDGGGHNPGALIQALPQAAGRLPVAPAPDYLLATLLEALIRQRAHDVVELPSPRGHLLDPLDLACVAELAEPVHSLSSVRVCVCSPAETSPAR